MTLSRRKFLGTSVAAALGATGLYSLLDTMAESAGAATLPPPPPPAGAARPGALAPPPPPAPRPAGPPTSGAPALGGEQYLFAPRTLSSNGVVVISPPLHHAVVTAKLAVPASAATQAALEAVLVELENEGLLDFTAGGGGVSLAWGSSYFAGLPTALTSTFLPIDLRASSAAGSTVGALIDAIAFASDPSGLILEQNDLAIVFASDSIANVTASMNAIFDGTISDFFEVTSIRRGFVDASQLGGSAQSLTKQMAVAAAIPGAALIPDQAELFLGFTSTQRNALAPSNVANLETLPGFTNQFAGGYFANGTAMHLSHLAENLPLWYSQAYRARVGAAFTPASTASSGAPVDTLPAPAPESESQVRSDLSRNGYVGHSSSMQPVSRLASPVRDNYGVLWPTGTAVPLRADFNTLDNPFSYSSNPTLDGYSTEAAAGIHFVAYTPTSTYFQQMRQAMDGQYADGSLGAAAVHGPFNQVLRATHRQNFLVPPKAHRSFPLAELL